MATWTSELPALVALSDAAAATAINAMTVSVLVPITSSQMLKWLGGNGRYQRLQALADATTNPTLSSVASVALMMLQRSDTTLDLNDPNDQAMVAAFETANVFQTDPATGLNESAELTAMATVTTPKYALVTQYDVHAARN